jgi:hypothetical protein
MLTRGARRSCARRQTTREMLSDERETGLSEDELSKGLPRQHKNLKYWSQGWMTALWRRNGPSPGGFRF